MPGYFRRGRNTVAEKNLNKQGLKARTRLLRELLEKKRLDYTHAAKELGTTSAVVKKFQEQGLSA